jgi:uncharacterized protein YjbI with pentapeptide repeats
MRKVASVALATCVLLALACGGDEPEPAAAALPDTSGFAQPLYVDSFDEFEPETNDVESEAVDGEDESEAEPEEGAPRIVPDTDVVNDTGAQQIALLRHLIEEGLMDASHPTTADAVRLTPEPAQQPAPAPTAQNTNIEPPPSCVILPEWGTDVRARDFRGCDFTNMSLRGLDLSYSDFTGADLEGADLREAKLERATLKNVNFYAANLRNADFNEANISGADFSGVQAFQDAKFTNVIFDRRSFLIDRQLAGVDFSGSDLSEVHLTGADLRSANFTKTNLYGATMDETVLREAVFKNTLMMGAYMVGADLQGVNLRFVAVDRFTAFDNANLQGVNFTLLTLDGISFENADMRGAILNGVSARHADFKNAGMENADLTNADLGNADLRNANMNGANVSDTSFKDTNLTGVEGLDLAQNIDIADWLDTVCPTGDISDDCYGEQLLSVR